MKRFLGFALLLTLIATPLLAKTKNSHTYLLTSDTKVGDTQLPQGRYDVSWSEAKGSEVQLSIKTPDKKTITVPAHVVKNNENNFGVETSVSNGVTTLKEFYTPTSRFVVDSSASVGK